MPTYEYRCRKCGHQFELFHGIKERARRRCPKCGGLAGRVPSGGAGVLFKGSGFYITDYRSEGYKSAAKADSGSGGSAEKKSDSTGSTESKPAAKPAPVVKSSKNSD